MNTSISSASGVGPHMHEFITTNQAVGNFGQITSVSQGHSHQIRYVNGQLTVLEVLGHTHTLVL
jgi:hypothetical protein